MTTEDEDHAEDYFNGANHDDCVDKKTDPPMPRAMSMRLVI